MTENFSSDELYVSEGNKAFLGRGTYASVYKCFDVNSRAFAVKLITVCGSKSEIKQTKESIQKELEILQKMRGSPYILDVFGLVEMYHNTGIVMEYMPRGTLSECVLTDKYGGKVSMALRFRILYEAAQGLMHLHTAAFDKRVTHNDLTPWNILLDFDFHAKICDFGGSNYTYFTKGWTNYHRSDTSDVHTEDFAAPEFIKGCKNGVNSRTRAMDVYSFAMVSYFTIVGKAHARPSSDYSLCTDERPSFPECRGYDFVVSNQGGRIVSTYDEVKKTTIKCWSSMPEDRPEMGVVVKDWEQLFSKGIMQEALKVQEDLKNKFPINEPRKEDSRVTLQEWSRSTLHNCVDHYNETNQPIVKGSKEANSILKLEENISLVEGMHVQLKTPHAIYVCRVQEVYEKKSEPKATAD